MTNDVTVKDKALNEFETARTCAYGAAISAVSSIPFLFTQQYWAINSVLSLAILSFAVGKIASGLAEQRKETLAEKQETKPASPAPKPAGM